MYYNMATIIKPVRILKNIKLQKKLINSIPDYDQSEDYFGEQDAIYRSIALLKPWEDADDDYFLKATPLETLNYMELKIKTIN